VETLQNEEESQDGHVLSLGWNQFEEMMVGWIEEGRMCLI